eukprot:TRINITY_DN40421_c0_g1_i1.p1 TRINITY_DN40421_c0_g1~~TRINITY_DN40421_c0_g1_i1.p1  ORF type:complete len:467 (-),score=76.39 TRINITY_DN40421_c0_g1_i1:188-1588(-)
MAPPSPPAYVESATCNTCRGDGPFEHAFLCSFKVEHARHHFAVCSDKCYSKFEKECVRAAQDGLEVKVARKVAQRAKKDVLFCPRCFYELKEVSPPVSSTEPSGASGVAPPPPPAQPRAATAADCSSVTVEELDIAQCVVHVKERDEEAAEGAARKPGKGKKKQAQREKCGDLMSAFFRDPAVDRTVTEDGELLHRSDRVGIAPTLMANGSAVRTTVPVTVVSHLSTASPAMSQVASLSATAVQSNPASMAPVKAKIAGLPPGWQAAWDPSSEDHYYYHAQSGEVTWERPGVESLERDPSRDAMRESPKDEEKRAEEAVIQPEPAVARKNVTSDEYLCVRSWVPRAEDEDCIRLLQGERLVLEGQTNGWGCGSVLPEVGERPRRGHFPMWAIGTSPLPSAATAILPGASCIATEHFEVPCGGYLQARRGDELVVRYSVTPHVWAYAEFAGDPARRGWIAVAFLRQT